MLRSLTKVEEFHVAKVANALRVSIESSDKGTSHPYGTAISDIFIERAISMVTSKKLTLVVGGTTSAFPSDGFHHVIINNDDKDTRRASSAITYCLDYDIPFIYLYTE